MNTLEKFRDEISNVKTTFFCHGKVQEAREGVRGWRKQLCLFHKDFPSKYQGSYENGAMTETGLQHVILCLVHWGQEKIASVLHGKYVKNPNKITLDKCVTGREAIQVVHYQAILWKKNAIVLLIQSHNALLLAILTGDGGVFTKIVPVPYWILLTSTISCMLRQIRVLPCLCESLKVTAPYII